MGFKKRIGDRLAVKVKGAQVVRCRPSVNPNATHVVVESWHAWLDHGIAIESRLSIDISVYKRDRM